MTRLLSDRELDDLARSPRDRLVEQCANASPSGVLEVVEGLEAGCNSQIDRYESWTAHLHRFEGERLGSEPIDLVATTLRLLRQLPGPRFGAGITSRDCRSRSGACRARRRRRGRRAAVRPDVHQLAQPHRHASGPDLPSPQRHLPTRGCGRAGRRAPLLRGTIGAALDGRRDRATSGRSPARLRRTLAWPLHGAHAPRGRREIHDRAGSVRYVFAAGHIRPVRSARRPRGRHRASRGDVEPWEHADLPVSHPHLARRTGKPGDRRAVPREPVPTGSVGRRSVGSFSTKTRSTRRHGRRCPPSTTNESPQVRGVAQNGGVGGAGRARAGWTRAGRCSSRVPAV